MRLRSARFFFVLAGFSAAPVLPQGPIAWYSFDERGAPGRDRAGGHDAVEVVGVSQPAGPIGLAAMLEDGWLQLPASSDFTLGAGDFTISALVQSFHSGYFFAKTYGAENRYGLLIRLDGRVSLAFQGRERASSAASVFDDEWHHMVGVKRGASVELWVDGALQGTAPIEATVDDGGSFALGSNGRCCASSKDTILDEAKIWDRALSAAEIAGEFARYRVAAAPLVGGRTSPVRKGLAAFTQTRSVPIQGGGTMVVFGDWVVSDRRLRLVGKRFDSQGVVQGGLVELSDREPETADDFDVVPDPQHGIVLSWGIETGENVVRTLARDGLPVGPSQLLPGVSDRQRPGFAVAPNGTRLVAWRPFHDPGRSLAVSCFDRNGKHLATTVLSAFDADWLPHSPQLVLTTDNILAIWGEIKRGADLGPFRVRARTVSFNCGATPGTKEVGEFDYEFFIFNRLSAARAATGGILLSIPGRLGLMMRMLTDDGQLSGDLIVLSLAADGLQSVAKLDDRRMVVVYRWVNDYLGTWLARVVDIAGDRPTISQAVRLKPSSHPAYNSSPTLLYQKPGKVLLTWFREPDGDSTPPFEVHSMALRLKPQN